MGGKRIICLLVSVVLIFFFSSCHPRHVSDIKPNMTKEEVASLWGRTPLVTYRTVNGKAVETWEYHFSNTDSICWVTFSEDRVAAGTERTITDRTCWSILCLVGQEHRDLFVIFQGGILTKEEFWETARLVDGEEKEEKRGRS